MDNEDSTIPYVTGTISNLSAGRQVTTQAKENYGSLMLMEKSLSNLKEQFMRSIAIKFHVKIQGQDQSLHKEELS